VSNKLSSLLPLLTLLAATLGSPLQGRVRAEDELRPELRPENGYWSVGEPRWFVATRSELGVPYAKPTLSVGYGMPHWIWAGLDVNALVTPDVFQAYAGVRATTPVLDVAFGLRDTWSLGKPFLLPARSFTDDSVNDAPGDEARYWAWEAEAVGTLPLPHSALVADFIVVRTLDVPKGSYLYDESYRVVVADPMFFALRGAAVVRFLAEDSLRVGVLVEYLFGMGRGDHVTRLGPIASLQLTDHLEINAALTIVESGPDDLGLQLGSYGIAGVRYRWATGERNPSWPWSEKIIP
jgi:hypothetical protein